MALLRTQRFCCPERDFATDMVLDFHPDVFHGLCLCSSVLGLAGMLFQALPRHHSGYTALSCGSLEKLKPAMRIGSMVNICSGLGSAGIMLRSVLWFRMSDAPLNGTFSNTTLLFSGPLCVVISTWIQYFYTVLFWAIFFYAVEAFLLLKCSGGVRSAALYCILSWGISSLVCLQGIVMLSVPTDSRCDSLHGLVLFHTVVTYVPLLLALLGNPVLLARAFCAVTTILRKKMGSYTASERLRKENLRSRFLKRTVPFTACWMGNVVTDLLLLLLELEPAWNGALRRLVQMAALTCWIIAAIMNPFYGLLHSLAFYGWKGCAVRCHWRRNIMTWAQLRDSQQDREEEEEEEEDCEGLGLHAPQDSGLGKVVMPNMQELMDSETCLEFGCSAMEIKAIRLLGTPSKALHADC